MPIANHETYCRMLDNAQQNGFAYPAINVASTTTANAALRAFAEARSDGIIQVSTGGGEFASGQAVKNGALGAISLAQHLHLMAEQYPVQIALHTDHCQPNHHHTDYHDNHPRPGHDVQAVTRGALRGECGRCCRLRHRGNP